MKIRCLIIDDEPLAVELLRQYVESVSYLELVGVSHSAIEALSLLHRQSVDLLFLDINMPLMDGLTCLKNIRSLEEESSKVPVALVSTSNLMKQEALEMGATYYFTKPVDQEIWNKIFDEVFSGSLLYFR